MSNLRRVSPEEAQRLVADEGYRYLDVRTEAEFAAGHPAGAENVPYLLAGAGGMTANPDFKRIVEALHPKEMRLVIGCKSGGRSLKAANELIAMGYVNVVDQRAGFDGARNAFGQVVLKGWRDVGLSVATTPAPGASYAELKARA